jgi:hypothetical protein
MLETGALRHSSIGFLGCGDLTLSHSHETVKTLELTETRSMLLNEQGNERRS